MALGIGQTAPASTLFFSENKLVSLRDYAGKNVVLLFFSMVFTGVCTAELCEIRDSL